MAAVRAKPAIVFIGFMGAGKSNAPGRGGAARGGGARRRRGDRAELGEPIASFFEREGEGAFRDREERVALELPRAGWSRLSLGGGAVESERVREAVRRSVGVWCRVDEETAWERSRDTGRPLAADRAGVLAALPRARARCTRMPPG